MKTTSLEERVAVLEEQLADIHRAIGVGAIPVFRPTGASQRAPVEQVVARAKQAKDIMMNKETSR